MEPGEDPMAFIVPVQHVNSELDDLDVIQVEHANSELDDLGVILDEDTLKVKIITVLSSEYDNERRTLDSKHKEELTMGNIRPSQPKGTTYSSKKGGWWKNR